ncbi:hypothetical protein PB1_15874 [Bacillus methanolicus PB1]|uniref:Uncharacterized protein n=1 Tax=Bacillus methanolicus PB1 TaxID=997296 RepID=I3DXT0_BACMT|nr:YrzE family protein [Bacillus methanolicus]EIJ79051.1 hypothetical protein PB1_15874 [Bacillus methanolicus PB1]
MISFLFLTLSLIFLVPILYFIPTGLTKKGKLIVLTVSFLLASFGLVANRSLGLWKTGLILFILTICITYILIKRMESALFEDVEKIAEGADQLLEPVNAHQSHSYPVHIPTENDDLDVSQTVEMDEIELSDSLQNEVSESFDEDNVTLARNSELLEETVPSLAEDMENLYLDDSLLTDLVQEEAEISEKTDNESEASKEIENEADYMAELEKIIMESEIVHEEPREDDFLSQSNKLGKGGGPS